jgi:2-oxoglutarate dehydrogenase E2 component (dihydrolipoamide succinyltransferase)
MPQLGESVTEGTVTRWLKKEGERVEADEPLLEVSTDKVDTEIPSPVSGILRGITVAEDETVAVGAELAVIDEEGATGAADAGAAGGSARAEAPAAPESPAAQDGAQPAASAAAVGQTQDAPASQPPPYQQPGAPEAPSQPSPYQQPSYQQPPSYPPAGAPEPAAEPISYQRPGAGDVPQQAPPQQPSAPPYPTVPPQAPAPQSVPQQAGPPQAGPPQAGPPQAGPAAPPQQAPESPAGADGSAERADSGSALTSGADGPYVTPLVRKLATEHGVDLASVAGTGVGGRIRKQDVLDASRMLREPGAAAAAAQPGQAPAPDTAAPAAAPSAAAQAPAAASATAPGQDQEAGQAPAAQARPAIVPSSLRGKTEQMSRARQVIAKRMVESLQTSAQLTTVVEADVTAIARLRDLAKADFEAREGVKLSFLPFFALAAVEALKVHPRLNAVIDTASAQVTYHDAEHLGIAVDTDRGLMVPVIRKAGDLNIGGLARKIADLAQRTRAGRVNPDDLSGGTFTLTNTGSRGALFDTPIINQPQVAILGTGTVVKRPVVVEDPALGEVIAVRSMVYLALTYDHRLVDGADAARFLVTMRSRLEEGAFETELGL